MLGILVEEAGQAEAEKMMSSFGPVVALANLGSTLQNTFAAGNRVLDILDEQPVTCFQILFSGSSCPVTVRMDIVIFSRI